MAQHFDFYTDVENAIAGGGSRDIKLRDFKIWMLIDSCETPPKKNYIKFNGYLSSMKKLEINGVKINGVRLSFPQYNGRIN